MPRYTVDIPDRLSTIFRGIAEYEQISMTDVFRRSLMTYAVLHEAVKRGSGIALTKDGVIDREVILTF